MEAWLNACCDSKHILIVKNIKFFRGGYEFCKKVNI